MRRERHAATRGPLTGARMQRGGGAPAVGLRLQAAPARAQMRRGGGEVKGVRCFSGVWVPFYRVGRGCGQPGMVGGGDNWRLHHCHYRE
jgi:hypothetical protein